MSPFTSPPDPILFNHLVWDLVGRVPPGRVVTYGQVARLLPCPQGVEARTYQVLGPRWVGAAMARCPQGVPWQRVLNAQGGISLRPGGEEQRWLLEMEGVQFNERGRVDLVRFGWQTGEQPGQPSLL